MLRRIGMVFQNYHLLDDLTVAENIDLPLTYKNLPAKERQAMVADILDRFQIVAKKDLYPSQLSGGQQQLVSIARRGSCARAALGRRANRHCLLHAGHRDHRLRLRSLDQCAVLQRP
jgi:ABC-type lipoprotein export system ATPase subunit